MRFVATQGDGFPLSLDYFDMVDSLEAPLIHKRNGEIIGYGTQGEWFSVYYNTTGTKTLNYWQRTVYYDTRAGSFQVNMPANPEDNHTIEFIEAGGSTLPLTVGDNTRTIEGAPPNTNDVLTSPRTVTRYKYSADAGRLD